MSGPVAYAIGVADPVSVLVDTSGTGRLNEGALASLVREHFRLTPQGIIEELRLRRPSIRKQPPTATSEETEPGSHGGYRPGGSAQSSAGI